MVMVGTIGLGARPHFADFWGEGLLNPLFVCTKFHTILTFQTPLSTRKFGRAGYFTLSSSRVSGIDHSSAGCEGPFWFISQKGNVSTEGMA